MSLVIWLTLTRNACTWRDENGILAHRQTFAMPETKIKMPLGSAELDVQQNENAEPLALKFRRLVAEWRHNTRYTSSLQKIVMDPSYQEILTMDKAALPFILKELQINGGHWFWAL